MSATKIFDGTSDPNIPDNVTARGVDYTRVWVGAFNSAMEDCMEEGDSESDCEGRAFPIAYASANEASKAATESLESEIVATVKKWLGRLWYQDENPPTPQASLESEIKQLRSKPLSDDAYIAFGGVVKSASIDGNLATVSALGVRFSNGDEKDLDDEYFTAKTFYGFLDGDNSMTTLNHRVPIKTKSQDVNVYLGNAKGYLFKHPARVKRVDEGLMVSHVLDLSNEYEAFVYELTQQGALRWSSGSAPHVVEKAKDGEIKSWPIIEFAYTPTAAEPRLPKITSIKSLEDTEVIMSEIDETTVDNVPATATDAGQVEEMVEEIQTDTFVTHEELQEIMEGVFGKFATLLDDKLHPLADKVEGVVKSIENGERELNTRPTGTTKSRKVTMRDTMARVNNLSFSMGGGVEGDGVENARAGMMKAKTDPRFGLGDDFNA